MPKLSVRPKKNIHKVDLKKVLTTLKSCLPHQEQPIGLHEPVFKGNEWKYVKECIDTRMVSSVGGFVGQFEKQLANYIGARSVTAVINGTAALHLSLKISGVNSADEVLMPALTFVAVANAVAYCGGTPHFVDSSEETLGVDPAKLNTWLCEIATVRNNSCINQKSGKFIKALVVVHTLGHPADLNGLLEVCNRFRITLIEDAAEAIGSLYQGKHVGNWGRLSILSFNGNKTITTGGGGAILTNDEKLGKFVKHLTTTAKIQHPWEYRHDEVGYNYRLPNLNAALGCAQLEELPQLLEKKRELAARYEKAFAPISGIQFFKEPKFARSNYWLNALLLNDANVNTRNALLTLTNEHHMMTRPAWVLMHQLPMYTKCPKMDLSQAEMLEKRLINIPSSPSL